MIDNRYVKCAQCGHLVVMNSIGDAICIHCGKPYGYIEYNMLWLEQSHPDREAMKKMKENTVYRCMKCGFKFTSITGPLSPDAIPKHCDQTMTNQSEMKIGRLTKITIVDKAVHLLLPGEATFYELNHTWYVGCPGEACHGIANLANHLVMHDKTTTYMSVTPSILCGCGAHYFIEQNKIRWC